MKLYGKADESWDDSRFQSIIEYASQKARKHGGAFVVGLESDGGVAVGNYENDCPAIPVCWACTGENGGKPGFEPALRDHNEYTKYAIGHLVPKLRDASVGGIVRFGGLQDMSDGVSQIDATILSARKMIKIHGMPFIVGMTQEDATARIPERIFGKVIHRKPGSVRNNVTMAPITERDRFVEQTACVVTKKGCWSLSDRIPYTKTCRHPRECPSVRWEDASATDLRSVRLSDATFDILHAILEHSS